MNSADDIERLRLRYLDLEKEVRDLAVYVTNDYDCDWDAHENLERIRHEYDALKGSDLPPIKPA